MIIVTGASGFIGKSLCLQLRAEGYSIVGLSRRPQHPDDTYFDLNDDECYLGIGWSKASHVIHLAAQGVKAGAREWAESIETNITGSVKLAKTLCDNNFSGRLITTKTFYEKFLGETPQLKQNPYICSKHAGSQIFDLVSSVSKFETTAVVIFQCYGPGDNPNNVLSYAAGQFARQEEATFGPCISKRDWIYIDDVVDLFISIVKRVNSEKIPQVDAGSGELVSIKDVIYKLAQLAGVSKKKMVFEEMLDRGDQEIAASASEFLKGWNHKHSLDEGLNKLINSELETKK